MAVTKFGADQTQTLDAIAAPVANVSLNNNKITNLATPTLNSDAATKLYVDNFTQYGASVKQSVSAATTVALPGANTYANGTSGVGATLTGPALTALGALDGVTLAVGDRLLVKNEAAGANNGIYTVTALGSTSTAYTLTRATDNDDGGPTPNDVVGAFVFVESGTTNANTVWMCSIAADTNVTMGTTAITWTQVSGLGDVTVTNPLSKSGNTLSLNYDNSTIGMNGSNQLFVPNGGITATQIAASFMPSGSGLTGGGGVTAKVNFKNDTNAAGITGIINGTNTAFTLSATPVANSLLLFRNGQKQSAQAATDYTIAGAVITFNTAPPTGNLLETFYLI